MREMLNPTSALAGMADASRSSPTARFSGASRRHPSAMFRRRLLPARIGLVEEGDIISIDIPNSKVNVNVSDEELRHAVPKVRSA